eukprot:scaffold102672_cov27-Tisochrysis_lutea.AAC.1
MSPALASWREAHREPTFPTGTHNPPSGDQQKRSPVRLSILALASVGGSKVERVPERTLMGIGPMFARYASKFVAQPLPSSGLPDTTQMCRSRSSGAAARAQGARLSSPSRSIISTLSSAHSMRTTSSSAVAPGGGVGGTISPSCESFLTVTSTLLPMSAAIELSVSCTSWRKADA